MSRDNRSGRTQRANVVRASFISAGRHHPQFMRPFEINATDDSIEDILLNLENRDFDADSLGGWAGDVINCVAQVDGADEALIPHGWEGERLRFFMHVELPDRISNDTMDFYVTGFTENDTIYELEGGALSMEDDTRLFINSIVRVRRTNGEDLSSLVGGSTDDRLNIEGNSHSLTAYTDEDHRRRKHTDFHTLRPYDVAAKLDSFEEDYTLDSRSDFSTNLTKTSARSNSLPNSYLGRTVSGLVEAHREVNTRRDWRNSSDSNPYALAQRSLGEKDQSKCKLQKLLKNQSGYLRNGYLTWEEAKEIFNGIDDDQYTNVLQSEEVERRGGRTSDLDGERFNGSDQETVSSYTALNSISGIMMESCIIMAHFKATTLRNGDVEFSFMRDTAPVFFIKGMTEEQEETNLYLFEKRLRQFVFDTLEFKVGVFDMEANMDTMGDSQFFLSIQGDKESEFWGATFADGSTSSLLTTRKGSQREIAQDSKRLSDALLGRK